MADVGFSEPQIPRKPALAVDEPSRSIPLTLVVSDHDTVFELLQKSEGYEREDYALTALRIGVLALKHARGQIDVDAVRREGEQILKDLNAALVRSRDDLHGKLTASLTEYFDPKDGRFQERVDRLVKHDGELEQVLRRQIGGDGSELAKTLSAHIGENSPLMKLIKPDEAEGLVSAIRSTISEVTNEEKNQILAQFSLDNENGALKRLVGELTQSNGRLRDDLAEEVNAIVQEFSLDKEDSALSRLVKRVEVAEETITKEFSLDEDGSALSRLSAVIKGAKDAIDSNLTLDEEGSALFRLKRELLEILSEHEEKASGFQANVLSALEAMQARKTESARSTQHGHDFEQAACEVIAAEIQKAADIPTRTGSTTGLIKNCKKGDMVVELGADCAAAGAKFVVEAKEDASYTVVRALAEIDEARKNRGAAVGLFVFSAKTAPEGIPTFARHGADILVVWDADRVESDIVLHAGLSVAKALCVRNQKERDADERDWECVDSSLLAIEKESTRLSQMKKWTETINSNSSNMLEEIRKMTNNLANQIEVLREGVEALKRA